ncbi:MAG: SRPBCC family protein [Gammaproteobacteria bacterium]|nr:SRPBCC family protein [Gammaproteobacteria bacterium]
MSIAYVTRCCNKKINTPAKKVWATVRQFANLHVYLPAATSCRSEGEGVGAKRLCIFINGMEIEEALEHLDDNRRILVYSISNGNTPFRNDVSTMQVTDVSDDQCKIEWKGSFDVSGENVSVLMTAIKEVFISAIDGIEQLHATSIDVDGIGWAERQVVAPDIQPSPHNNNTIKCKSDATN